jgi:lipopolysaccharide exporter
VTSVVSQVMFPTFSKLADGNLAQLGQIRARYYLTTMRYISWLTVPIAIAMILFASEFFLGIYGPTWAPAIVPLQLLAIYGLIRSVAANMGSIFRGLGKPQWLTYIATWRLITMLVTLYPVTKRWGINGVSALSVIVAIVDFVISATLVSRLVEVRWRAYADMLIPTCAAAIAAGLLAQGAYNVLPLHKASIKLLIAGAVMVVLYGLFAWLVDRRFRDAARMIAGQGLRLWRERSAPPVAAPAPRPAPPSE